MVNSYLQHTSFFYFITSLDHDAMCNEDKFSLKTKNGYFYFSPTLSVQYINSQHHLSLNKGQETSFTFSIMPKYLAFTIQCETKSKMPKEKKKNLKTEVPFDMYTQTSTYQFLSNVSKESGQQHTKLDFNLLQNSQ